MGNGCYFGDNSRIGKYCNFESGCGFGTDCSFESGNVRNGKYVAIDRIGREKRKAYFFMDCEGNVFVRAGCFFGGENQFVKKVNEHHTNTKHRKHYLQALELAKLILSEDE